MSVPRKRLTRNLRIASWSLAAAGIFIMVVFGSRDGEIRQSAIWMRNGSTLLLAAIILSIINVILSRHRR